MWCGFFCGRVLVPTRVDGPHCPPADTGGDHTQDEWFVDSQDAVRALTPRSSLDHLTCVIARRLGRPHRPAPAAGMPSTTSKDFAPWRTFFKFAMATTEKPGNENLTMIAVHPRQESTCACAATRVSAPPGARLLGRSSNIHRQRSHCGADRTMHEYNSPNIHNCRSSLRNDIRLADSWKLFSLKCLLRPQQP